MLLLVLFCQLLSAWIPHGMMAGASGPDSSLLVFCGAQNDPALLKMMHGDWKNLLTGKNHTSDFSSEHLQVQCTFSSLASAAIAASDLGPQNKAPPTRLFV